MTTRSATRSTRPTTAPASCGSNARIDSRSHRRHDHQGAVTPSGRHAGAAQSRNVGQIQFWLRPGRRRRPGDLDDERPRRRLIQERRVRLPLGTSTHAWRSTGRVSWKDHRRPCASLRRAADLDGSVVPGPRDAAWPGDHRHGYLPSDWSARGGVLYGEGHVLMMSAAGDIVDWVGGGVGRPTGPEIPGQLWGVWVSPDLLGKARTPRSGSRRYRVRGRGGRQLPLDDVGMDWRRAWIRVDAESTLRDHPGDAGDRAQQRRHPCRAAGRVRDSIPAAATDLGADWGADNPAAARSRSSAALGERDSGAAASRHAIS